MSSSKQPDLQAIYEKFGAYAIHRVKPDNIATFLGYFMFGDDPWRRATMSFGLIS